jgi:hypothetical protein
LSGFLSFVTSLVFFPVFSSVISLVSHRSYLQYSHWCLTGCYHLCLCHTHGCNLFSNISLDCLHYKKSTENMIPIFRGL